MGLGLWLQAKGGGQKEADGAFNFWLTRIHEFSVG